MKKQDMERGMRAKGYSDCCRIEVEGPVHFIYSNGIDILTRMGLVFCEDGKYEVYNDKEGNKEE